jgi:hypothetical protein
MKARLSDGPSRLNNKSTNAYTVSDFCDSHLWLMLRTMGLDPAGSPSVPTADQQILKFRNQSETSLYNKVATAHPNGAKRKHTAPTHTHTHTHTLPFPMCVCVNFIQLLSSFYPFTFSLQGTVKSPGERTNPKPFHPSIDIWNSVTCLPPERSTAAVETTRCWSMVYGLWSMCAHGPE